MNKQHIDKFELLYSDLLDLHNRLVLDYAGDQKFEQFEEDRLVVGNLLNVIGKMINVKKYRQKLKETPKRTF